ncbi:MAG: folylpolyglutamate synthase/dihydrofolate synthase family protein [Pseudomonadota bacterium]
MTSIEAALDRIAARRPRVIDLSLDRVHAALERLGDPHRKLPPVFHVAGTNGKGSTVAFLRACLEAAGHRVHVYTSPHLVRYNERVVLAGEEISDAAFIDALRAVEDAVGDEKLTFFETLTCAAYLAFAETPADFAVIEVGLGGRLDATNVLDRPLAAVVSPVDFDHQKFLGDTLREIASEKAGVFRAGAPAVIGRQDPEAMATLMDRAGNVGAEIYAMGRDWDAYPERGRLTFQDQAGLMDLDAPKLPGRHQIDNAALGVAAIRAAGLPLTAEELSAGLVRANWPARLQRLSHGPLIDRALALSGGEVEMWLDGGHNPHAARAVAQVMADLEARHPRPLALIAGLQANKDMKGYFTPFAGLARGCYAVAAHQDGAAPASDVAEAAAAAGISAKPFETIDAALEAALSEKKNEPPRVLIGGSLYLAGEILKENG